MEGEGDHEKEHSHNETGHDNEREDCGRYEPRTDYEEADNGESREKREDNERETNEYQYNDQGGHDGGEDDSRTTNENAYPDTMNRPQVPRRRDLRQINYAFGEPKLDEAQREAQEWLENLALADEEERNPSTLPAKGPKYRTGTNNASPQMYERLQKCEQDQVHYVYKSKAIPRTEKRNASATIYPVLHVEEENANPQVTTPVSLWGNTRRSATGNNSNSVYAVLHPSLEIGRKHVPSSQNK